MTAAPTGYAATILKRAKIDTASKINNWPGTPLSHVPSSANRELHFLINNGYVTIVERPRSTGAGTVSYIVAN